MKRALVISGGGSKGAFSVGVIKDLVQTYHLKFDVLVGTSTGALITPLAALGMIDKLEELYTTVDNNQIIKKYNFGQRVIDGKVSIFSFEPLKSIISKTYNDAFFNNLMMSDRDLYITTVCLQTQKLVVFTNAKNPVMSSYYQVQKFVNADQFRAAVLASASQPVFTPPVKVNESVAGDAHKDYQFVDGGVREYAGVAIAADTDVSEIFTVLHSARKFKPAANQFTDIFSVLQQTIDMFITDVSENDLLLPFQYNAALKYIQSVKNNMKDLGVSEADINKYFTLSDLTNRFQNRPPLKIHVIQPENPLGGGPGGLDFNPTEMMDMLANGRLALQSYVAQLPPDSVDWA
jgi:NTE family protein